MPTSIHHRAVCPETFFFYTSLSTSWRSLRHSPSYQTEKQNNNKSVYLWLPALETTCLVSICPSVCRRCYGSELKHSFTASSFRWGPAPCPPPEASTQLRTLPVGTSQRPQNEKHGDAAEPSDFMFHVLASVCGSASPSVCVCVCVCEIVILCIQPVLLSLLKNTEPQFNWQGLFRHNFHINPERLCYARLRYIT